MNGAHDMGGMHGYGAIEPEPEVEEPVFHCDWEKRVFGLTLAAAFLGEWNADMSRHARERQQPLTTCSIPITKTGWPVSRNCCWKRVWCRQGNWQRAGRPEQAMKR